MYVCNNDVLIIGSKIRNHFDLIIIQRYLVAISILTAMLGSTVLSFTIKSRDPSNPNNYVDDLTQSNAKPFGFCRAITQRKLISLTLRIPHFPHY